MEIGSKTKKIILWSASGLAAAGLLTGTFFTGMAVAENTEPASVSSELDGERPERPQRGDHGDLPQEDDAQDNDDSGKRDREDGPGGPGGGHDGDGPGGEGHDDGHDDGHHDGPGHSEEEAPAESTPSQS